MTKYRVFETDEFLKSLDKLDKASRSFVEGKLSRYAYPQLKETPQYGANIKKLRGYKPDTWRYRLGPFRLFYTLNEAQKIIEVLSVDFRKDAYR